MKKLLAILVLGLLLSGNAYAVPVEFEILNHNINYLVKKGYKITFVNNDDKGTVYYTLEDNLYLKKGVLASNAQLVEKAIRIITDMGATTLTPEETRQKLKLKKHK